MFLRACENGVVPWVCLWHTLEETEGLSHADPSSSPRRFVQVWVYAYRNHRLDAIAPKRQPGCPGKLPVAVKGEATVQRLAGRRKTVTFPGIFCEDAWLFTAADAVKTNGSSAEREGSVHGHGAMAFGPSATCGAEAWA